MPTPKDQIIFVNSSEVVTDLIYGGLEEEGKLSVRLILEVTILQRGQPEPFQQQLHLHLPVSEAEQVGLNLVDAARDAQRRVEIGGH